MHSSRVLETTVAATVVMLNRQRQGCRTTDMKFCQSTEQRVIRASKWVRFEGAHTFPETSVEVPPRAGPWLGFSTVTESSS